MEIKSVCTEKGALYLCLITIFAAESSQVYPVNQEEPDFLKEKSGQAFSPQGIAVRILP